MKKITLMLSLILLAACSATPTVVVPTLAVLPTLTASSTVTPSDEPSAVSSPTLTTSSTVTSSPTQTFSPPPSATPLPSATPTPLPSATLTETPTSPPTFTYTPSLTITNTRTPLPSATFTASPELDNLGMLALLSQRATILPPEMLYNPPTLTAVAYAAQTLVAIGVGLTPSPSVSTPLPGVPQLATLPPPLTTTTCTVPPPAGLASAFAADPTLTQAVGCPQGSVYTTTTAIESFEHGSLIYVQGSPSAIYALTLDGRFRRFDDTWVAGVDPETGGETPPLGLLEPKRGFGKIWRGNFDVRAALGWAVTEEQGASSSVQIFERGRAVFLPQRGESYLLIDDPGGASGAWRALPTGF